MATLTKAASTSTVTVRHIRLSKDTLQRIRKFRAKRELANAPIRSDEMAMLELIDRGLEAENLNF